MFQGFTSLIMESPITVTTLFPSFRFFFFGRGIDSGVSSGTPHEELVSSISISMFEQAKQYNQDDYIAKLKKYSEAYEITGDIVPLAFELSRLYLDRGKVRKANRVIEKSWKLNPHPDLFKLFKSIHKFDSREKFLRRIIKISESLDSSNIEVCLNARIPSIVTV